jgi:hypothetical protein
MTDRSRFGPGYLMPPAPFPVYGLDESFTGARWLELFGDPPGSSPTWMSLNHQAADGRSLINVTTFVRRATGNLRSWRVPTDAQAAERGRSPLADVAGQGATTLISLTLPVRSLARPPGFLNALVEHAEAAASAYRDWPQASWRVDGVPVQVPVWWFAGGWTALTDTAAGVYLSVAGIGPDTSPEDLGLAALRDGRAYHFDLDGPLSIAMAQAAAEAAGVPLGPDPSWQRREWHPGQLQLIRELTR